MVEIPDRGLATERLTLRRWRPDDRPAFREMNADPEVMATIGPPLSMPQSDALLDRIEATFDQHGFGLWCVDVDGDPAGWVGLSVPAFMPADVEIGWRLRRSFWGHGYATEAATAAITDAFGRLGLDAVMSMTAVINTRSRAVMERLGMTRDLDADFEHPSVPDGSDLRPHVLYRLTRRDWSGHRSRGAR